MEGIRKREEREGKASGKRRQREDGRERKEKCKKWEGGEGNQVDGNFIHPWCKMCTSHKLVFFS